MNHSLENHHRSRTPRTAATGGRRQETLERERHNPDDRSAISAKRCTAARSYTRKGCCETKRFEQEGMSKSSPHKWSR